MTSSFYGKDEPEAPAVPKTRAFKFNMPESPAHVREVKAHHVFFYESGHVGFWNDERDGGRALVLAVKAADVWEGE